jgi:tricorn protease-like protein
MWTLLREPRVPVSGFTERSQNIFPVVDGDNVIGDAKNLSLGLDWSPNGKEILVSQANPSTHHSEIWLLPVPGMSSADDHGRRMVFDPAYDLHQQTFSPDGRWIAFQAVRDLQNKLESTLFVTAATGGPWIRITDSKHWDDKPRWSPDGKVIYFVSGRSGFFNLWAIHFDPARGRIVRGPTEVTKFNSPARLMPEHVPSVDLSVAQNNLLLTLEQRAGNIWVLDNVDQ